MKRKECKVIYVDNLKTDYEIKAKILKTEEFNRAKKKEETRKLAEDYLGVER